MSDESNLNARFEDLMEFIDAANEKVAGGEMADLGDLEETVSALCREAEAAPEDRAEEIKPLMTDMISRLDTLARTLKDYQDNKSSDG